MCKWCEWAKLCERKNELQLTFMLYVSLYIFLYVCIAYFHVLYTHITLDSMYVLIAFIIQDTYWKNN